LATMESVCAGSTEASLLLASFLADVQDVGASTRIQSVLPESLAMYQFPSEFLNQIPFQGNPWLWHFFIFNLP